MRLQRKKATPTLSTGGPAPEATSAPEPKHPGNETYLNARAEWNERYGSYVAAARNWRTAFFLSAAVSLIAVGGVVHIGSQSRLVPYIVEVNQLGDALAAQRADVASTPDTRLIRAQLARWVNGVRTVYLDAGAEKAIVTEAYGMVDRESPAYPDLNAYFQKNDPFQRAQTQTVNVHVTSVLPISPDTWRVEWIEETNSRDGSQQSTAHWQATVSIVLHPPTDSQTVLLNPTGLYIQNFSWAEAQQ